MSVFLIQLGTMSFQASVAIAAVLVFRKVCFRLNVPKKYVIILWNIPFFLLICPWKMSSPVGIWEYTPNDKVYVETVIQQIEKEAVLIEKQEVSQGNDKADFNEQHMKGQESVLNFTWKSIGMAWGAGVAVTLGYAILSYLRLMKKIQCNIPKEENVYWVDELHVPIAAGFIRPKIYLPSEMPEEYLFFAVEHEKTHIDRKDPLIKLGAYIIVCIHWFNPMVWTAYHFFEKDMEMACDEETLQRIGTERKKEYAAALIQLSVGTRRIFTVPLAFGEGDIKGRIKNVMRYKKTIRGTAVLAVLSGVAILSIFVTKRANPSKLQEITNSEENIVQETQMEWTDEVPVNELTFEMVREAAAEHTLHGIDFHSYSNGEKWYFEDKNALNYYVNFYYEYQGDIYKLGASYGIETDELWAVYITRETDDEMRWLYDYDDGKHEYSDYLESFLAVKEDVAEWLEIKLPTGYELGNYQAYLGLEGGALILPQAYELYGDEVFAPQEWYHAGFVGKISYAEENFVFKNGRLIDGEINWWNHSSCEKLGVLDLDWQALLAHYNHDLYTAAGIGWLEEDGIDTSLIDTTSDYWYFFFAKEGEERAYYLSLSQKLFTKEEAIAVAETVKIVE